MNKCVRGVEKRMVVVRTGDSGIFDEAIFVFREGEAREEKDIVEEAKRIIGQNVFGQSGEEKIGGLWRAVLWYAFGFVSGAGLIGLIWTLICH